MTPTEKLLAALRDHGRTPKQSGKSWTCRCPAHEDRNPSLSISTGDDGRALVMCHAGCTFEAICGAINLKTCDLMPDNGTEIPRRTPRRRPRATASSTNSTGSPISSSSGLDATLKKVQAQCSEERLSVLAADLGVPIEAVRSLTPGWADA